MPKATGSVAQLWRRYEVSVRELLAAMDPESSVSHNVEIVGTLSNSPRQVDVLAVGSVAGLDIRVAAECKRHTRPLEIGVVDQFIGKLLDLRVDRGLLYSYSYSGFSDAAVRRCQGAANPQVMAIALKTPEVVARNRGAPGYPADLLVQEDAPQWLEELSTDSFRDFLMTGAWSKFWS